MIKSITILSIIIYLSTGSVTNLEWITCSQESAKKIQNSGCIEGSGCYKEFTIFTNCIDKNQQFIVETQDLNANFPSDLYAQLSDYCSSSLKYSLVKEYSTWACACGDANCGVENNNGLVVVDQWQICNEDCIDNLEEYGCIQKPQCVKDYQNYVDCIKENTELEANLQEKEGDFMSKLYGVLANSCTSEYNGNSLIDNYASCACKCGNTQCGGNNQDDSSNILVSLQVGLVVILVSIF